MRDEADVYIIACSITACVLTKKHDRSLFRDTLEEILGELGYHHEERNIWRMIKQTFNPVENPLGVLNFPDVNDLYRRAQEMFDRCTQYPMGNARLEIIQRHLAA